MIASKFILTCSAIGVNTRTGVANTIVRNESRSTFRTEISICTFNTVANNLAFGAYLIVYEIANDTFVTDIRVRTR